MPQQNNQYDEQAKDFFKSKTLRYTCGCFAAMFAFAFIGTCLAFIFVPAIAGAIMKGLGL